MFGKVKCTACKTSLKKDDVIEIKVDTAKGSRVYKFCVPCATLLNSEMPFV